MVSTAGSSPRVRGTLHRITVRRAKPGIIPACAGNTYKDRMRVEYREGSSPRVRGTRFVDDLPVGQAGIIPACAGNTSARKPSYPPKRDHPRVCGEHMWVLVTLALKRGSSPRVRGTQSTRFFRTLQSGIIPACAGNTAWPTLGLISVRDHPRVCGEHETMDWSVVKRTGSSPRVRGTRTANTGKHRFIGIIPACAGNTLQQRSYQAQDGDHPRVCGEHTVTPSGIDTDKGSSPRVRGTHRHALRYRHR